MPKFPEARVFVTPPPNRTDLTAEPPAPGRHRGGVVGVPCWVSLMARDLGAALDFYGAVFGWSFRSG
ncbi:hypothetical protein ABZX93_32840, partial [Streptomyces sp. NPDC006632]